MRSFLLACVFAAGCGAAAREARGVILLDSGDPTRNTSTPGDNSGWQYEGQFGGFLGTPIAPRFFVTAKHIGGGVGQAFTFHGETFTTTAAYPDPDSDLQIWQVDHAFACYAPLYQPVGTSFADEVGRELRVFGRGTQRGPEMDLGGTARGWAWGTADGLPRWGRNAVDAVVSDGTASYLQAGFDSPGLPGEAHLSVGDSGGGVFILQGGLWRLAATNYGVDDLYTAPRGDRGFAAAIFDARGYYAQNGDGTFTLLDGPGHVPTSFYSTQISARLAWIKQTTGSDGSTLPPEDFAAWQHAYFTPDQLADATVSGPGADPDVDGVPNLLEFAFNLDPSYAEPAVMTAGTGLRGLPLVRLEAQADSSVRLTVEFVRRTTGSGSGVAYAVQFRSSLAVGSADWQTGGTESVTAINARWERVKVTDGVAVDGTVPQRFARVAVTPQAAAQPAARAAVRRNARR